MQYVVYVYLRKFVIALKERCSVVGVQPVVGTGMLRVKTVGVGVPEPEDVAVDAVGVGVVSDAALHVACWSARASLFRSSAIVLPMKPPTTPATTAISSPTTSHKIHIFQRRFGGGGGVWYSSGTGW